MLSSDLQSLRGALECYAERYEGRLFFDVAGVADLFRTFDGLIDQATQLEGAVIAATMPSTPRALPDGVADLAARRRTLGRDRPAEGRPIPTDPAGGSAA